jgi:hypothetical protein
MASKQDVEAEGAKPRDHEHARQRFWKAPHKSPLLWIAVVIMLGAILVYVFTNDFSHSPGQHGAVAPTPAAP